MTNKFNVGDKVKAKVLSIDPDKQKVALGLKQLEENPYEKYPVGMIIEPEVKIVQRSGAHFKLDDDLEAYLHVSKFSTEKIEDLRDTLKEGDKVKCKVIKNNPEKNLIEVSVTSLLVDVEKAEIHGSPRVKLTLGNGVRVYLRNFPAPVRLDKKYHN